jgi:hypothetical protein
MDEIEKYIDEENMNWFKKQTAQTIAALINQTCKSMSCRTIEPVQTRQTDFVRQSDAVAAFIGQKGETDVRELLRKTNLWILEEKKTKSKSGDIRAKPSSDPLCPIYPLMVEVKNYKNNIPYSEVEKFHRDLHNNIEYSMGLFISIDRKICNIDSSIYYETKLINGKYRFLVYLSFVDEKIIKVVSEVLMFQFSNSKKLNESDLVQINQIIDSINNFHSLKIQLESMKGNVDNMIRLVDKIYFEMDMATKKLQISNRQFEQTDSLNKSTV